MTTTPLQGWSGPTAAHGGGCIPHWTRGGRHPTGPIIAVDGNPIDFGLAGCSVRGIRVTLPRGQLTLLAAAKRAVEVAVSERRFQLADRNVGLAFLERVRALGPGKRPRVPLLQVTGVNGSTSITEAREIEKRVPTKKTAPVPIPAHAGGHPSRPEDRATTREFAIATLPPDSERLSDTVDEFFLLVVA